MQLDAGGGGAAGGGAVAFVVASAVLDASGAVVGEASANGTVRAGEAVAEGHWLVADRQLAGRGRQGRGWFDGSGALISSLHPPLTTFKRGNGSPSRVRAATGNVHWGKR